MLKRFIENITLNFPNVKSGKTLLAVSGGLDSVAMVHFFFKCGFKFGIAHCNFQLRGADSLLDEALVQSLAQSLGVPFHSVLLDTKKFAADEKISTQMAARKLRYDYFEKIRLEFNYDLIATAHHKNDNLENFFIYLFRNNLNAAFTGISSYNNHLIRPLLLFAKEEIASFANEEGIVWREDRSNFSDSYLRNKIRIHLLPQLQEEYKEIFEDYEELNRETQIYHLKLRKKILQVFNISNFSQAEYKVNQSAANSSWFSHFLHELYFDDTEIRLIRNMNQAGKKIAGVNYTCHRTSAGYEVVKNNLPANEKENWQHNIYQFPEIVQLSDSLIYFHERSRDELRSLNTQNYFYFDIDQLNLPLVVRNYRQGDRMKLFRSNYEKKVSDILIDLKIPNHRKNSIPVLADAVGNILSIANLKRSNIAICNMETTGILELYLENQDEKYNREIIGERL